MVGTRFGTNFPLAAGAFRAVMKNTCSDEKDMFSGDTCPLGTIALPGVQAALGAEFPWSSPGLFTGVCDVAVCPLLCAGEALETGIAARGRTTGERRG